MPRSRTNIELDDEHLELVMRRYGIATKTEAVAVALRYLAGEPFGTEQALQMRGAHAIGDLPADVGPCPAG